VRLARRPRTTTLLALSLLVAACGDEGFEEIVQETRATGVRVALVGIDGASPRILAEEMRRGRLPTFERLAREGASGVLLSREPMKSPAIWTTIVTGRTREEHGITDFRATRERLVTSDDRRTLALWNITSRFGLENGFAGFWATWPAEPVKGWMVSDRIAQSRFAQWVDGARRRGAAWPPDLTARVVPLLVDPLDPPMAEIESLVELTAPERRELLAARKPIFGHAFSVLKFAYATQRSFERIALDRLDRGPQPDLFGVFLIANDPIGHTFWHWYRPRSFRDVDPRRAERLGRIVPAMYAHNDRFLDSLLERLGRDTVVLVLSDHGFEASGLTPRPVSPDGMRAIRAHSRRIGQVAVGQSGKHHLEGVFLASGGPIRAGIEVRASILDVAPTVLALLGLPVARDLPGRVLVEILDPAFLERHPVRYLDSYEGRIERRRVPVEAPLAETEMVERLRALGYLEPEPTGDDPAPGAPPPDGSGG